MRSLLTNGLAVLFLTMATTTVTAAGPFGLFNHSSCCDQASCDSQCGCDSTGCGSTECDSCGQTSDCCESDCCDSGCDSCCDTSHSCGSICKRDFCCCCPRPCTYWSLFGGWTTINDYNGEAAAVPHSGDLDDGWAIGIARGRRFDHNLRGELEFSYRRFDADTGAWPVPLGTGTVT